MKFKDGVVKFTAWDNPTRENLLSLDPNLVIPDSYNGLNSTPALAQLFVNAVNNGDVAEFAELLEPLETVYEQSGGFEVFSMEAARFKVQNPAAVYYDMLGVLDLNDGDQYYYLLLVCQKYKDEMVHVSPTLKILYSYDEQGGRDENGLITLDTLEKYFLLNSTLRDEGIVLDGRSLFICSFRWGERETLNLLLDGMDLQEAVKMYEIGFTTIEEINEYYNSVPASWRSKLFGDDVKAEEEDY